MGDGVTITCKKCGYSETLLEGIGFAYTMVMDELREPELFEELGLTKRLYTHRHMCDRCSHIMHAESLKKRPGLKCPRCGKTCDYVHEEIMWD